MPKQKQQVPECRYGAACTRKDCIFRHPPKKQAAKNPEPKSDKVCFAFVAGRCVFGKGCRDQHPDEDSCRTIRGRYSNIDCQWGRGCRTEGCLYRHPSDEPVGPALVPEPPKRQPAVFAEGPTIVPQAAGGGGGAAPDDMHKGGPIAQIPIPKAIVQAADLRDVSAFDISDPLDRFCAVNARNTGTQSAALLDLHFQSAQTSVSVLDLVLPERLKMFPQGVWIVTGATLAAQRLPHQRTGDVFEVVREYLARRRYAFAVGIDAEGQRCAYLVRGQRQRAKREDVLEGVRAILLCGLPGSGKTTLAEALAQKSGRYVKVSQEDLQGDRASTESAFRQALEEANSSFIASHKKVKCFWWDQAFSNEKHYLAISLRVASLAFLNQFTGITLPCEHFLHATVAFQPTALDLRRFLGRPYRVSFRMHLVLEATASPNDHFEAILCAARPATGATTGKTRPIPLYIPLVAPRHAAGHLQVLNAVPLEKRIYANSMLGSFKVRQVLDLQGAMERIGFCLLMNKTGEARDLPATVSFDAAALLGSAASSSSSCEWTEVGDAALASVDPLVVLEDVGGDSDFEWLQYAQERCQSLRMEAPRVQVSRPMGRAESKYEQWHRLKPCSLLHCAADEADAASFLREGAAVMHRGSGAQLPPMREAPEPKLRRVVVLDRCNAGRQERRHWLQQSGLHASEVVAVHLDVPESECISRVSRRGTRHPTTKVSSTVEASAAVRTGPAFEAPNDRDGFKSLVKLKAQPGQGPAAVMQDLVRRWTEASPSGAEQLEKDENDQHDWWSAAGGQYDEDAIADAEVAPPPLPTLHDWIQVETEEHFERRPPAGPPPSVWQAHSMLEAHDDPTAGGSSASRAVPHPLTESERREDMEPNYLEMDRELQGPGWLELPVMENVGRSRGAGQAPPIGPLGGGRGARLAPPIDAPPIGPRGGGRGARLAPPIGPPGGLIGPDVGLGRRIGPEVGLGATSASRNEPEVLGAGGDPLAPGRSTVANMADEDDEEWIRQEQLAATLRCMGFDEAPAS